MMRALLVATALAMLMSPINAQTQTQSQTQRTTSGQAQQAKQLPAQAGHGPNDVWCGGQYLGSDPDPNVRLELLRNYGKKDCD